MQSLKSSLVLWAALAMVSGLSACGGGGSDDTPLSSSTALTVTPSLGRILNAAIEARCLATGKVLGSGSTDPSGPITLSGTCSGPVLVELLANGGTQYFDEFLGALVALPAGSALRAIVPTFTAGTPLNLAITPLTEIATRQAIAAAGSEAAVTATQALAANTAVVTQIFGSGVSFDILTPPTVVDSSTASASLGTTDADRHAVYLAALANLGSGSTPAWSVTSTLASDLADGSLDGGDSAGFTYASSNFATLLDAAITVAAQDYANSGLQTELGVAPTVPVDVTSLSTTSGAVNDQITINGTGFDSDPFHLEVKFSTNVAAEIVSASSTQIVVKVPAGAITGPISVKNIISNTSDTSGSFTVTGGGVTPTTWTLRNSPSAYLFNSIAHGNGTFVAVGAGKTIMTSSNGVSWTTQTGADANFFAGNAITWDGSQFIMVGDSSNLTTHAPLIATSPDGVTWTRRTWTHGSTTQLTDVSGNANRLTAVGLGATIITSTDQGATWTTESTPSGAVTDLYGVTDNGSTRIAVGRNDASQGVVLINTGSGWSKVNSYSSFIPKDVIWTGSQFVAVGASSVNYGANAVVMYSSDGTSWTQVNLPTTAAPAGYVLRDVVWTGSTLYAVGDDSNKSRVIVSSVNAIDWTQAHQSTNTSGQGALEGIAASGSVVVTVGGTKSVTLP